MTIITRDGVTIEHPTTAQFIEDLRNRILYAPEIPGKDRRAFPPVDWTKVAADEAADAAWQQQFEDDSHNDL